jgi:hypothetical protein
LGVSDAEWRGFAFWIHERGDWQNVSEVKEGVVEEKIHALRDVEVEAEGGGGLPVISSSVMAFRDDSSPIFEVRTCR